MSTSEPDEEYQLPKKARVIAATIGDFLIHNK